MKKTLLCITLALLFPMILFSQTYAALWKQVSDAQKKDLPKTEQEVLRKIAAKAEKEHAYGQLLKAQLQEARSLCEVAPDSLTPVVERLKAAEAASADVPLQAIYNCVLGYIYENNRWLDEDRHQEIGREYYAKALAHPAELAAVKATDYDPFVLRGQDSHYFGDDLLSLIGYEAERYDVLRDYYVQAGNRRAALLATDRLLSQEEPHELEPYANSRHLQRLDSIISEYQDLVECGELALSRYNFMEANTDATAEQEWNYINLALERWGAWPRMNYLRNRQRELMTPTYHAEVPERVMIPQRQQTVNLTRLRNITGLTLRVYKVNADGNTSLNPENTDDYKKLKPLLTALPELTATRSYSGHQPYEFFEDSVQLGALPVGVYMLELESQPATEVSRQLYFVSDLRVLAQLLPENQLRLVAVNATTGQPAKKATIEVSYGYGASKVVKKLTTDAKGECHYTQDSKRNRSYNLRAYTSGDNACPDMNVWGQFYFPDHQPSETSTAIFTDRAIYRPGQTVHAAAVVYTTQDGRNHQTVEGREVTMQLRDANHKVVSEQRVTTDAFGSCHADFVLPRQGLTGQFTIAAGGNSHYFSVEEYKRPTFEVNIPRPTVNYADGDTVEVTGTALSYAGVPVQQATVKYRVVRRLAFWWMSYSRYWEGGFYGTGSDDEEVVQGETTTDDRGQFTVRMPMVLPKTKYPMFYNFVLMADVTDQAGETHQATMSLPLGNRKTAFSVSLAEKVLNESNTQFTFHLQNAAGTDLDARVRYQLDGERWQEAPTNKAISLPRLKSGRHTLTATCQEDTVERSFVVFSLDDRRPATDDLHSWFFLSDNRFPQDGSPVTMQAGSVDKDVHVVYTIISGNKVLESGTEDLSNQLINRKFAYKEEYDNGLLLTFAWVKDGQTYKYTNTVQRPMPDRKLRLSWQTFRNRLVPGQQEEWTLKVSNPDGTPADAQLMATLYDKSLDQLASHSWGLYPGFYNPMPQTNWISANWGGNSFHGAMSQSSISVKQLTFNRFDHNVFPSYSYYRRNMRFARTMMAKGAMVVEEAPMMELMDVDAVEEETFKGMAVASQKATDNGVELEADEAETDEAQQEQVQMRENLQETAFFMPRLMCDSTGQVTMKFTLPESLTTWRFMGLAHTKDMLSGLLTDEAVAKKDVMIQPNMPRFVREGDQPTISARVINTSDKAVSGTAVLQLLDSETEKILLEQKQQVSIPDSSTVAVDFRLPTTDFRLQPGLYIVRMSVVTDEHSDGEQHYLPVLPATERVTVTVPFTQIGPGTKEIDLTKLIPQTADLITHDSKLTIEYTNNPAWLMIQALPAVGHPHDDCAICQVTSYYANSIGRHILKQNPTAKHVFEQWKQENTPLTSLNSSLQKDEELKDLLLNETPWVMDADREQEQKERLADFFDQNTIDQRLSTALENLRKLQRGNGSWSWWPDMHGSPYMTTAVTELLVRLNEMTSQQSETRQMLSRAFDFLGNNIVELVNEMKKQEKKGIKQYFPSHRALEWLFLCAIDGRQLPAKVTEANNYLTNLLKKETRNQTIYEKALSAIVLKNPTYVKSLKEWTVYREDMGRYYDTQRASYSWRDYKIPTQVAAIEALKQMTPEDTVTISEMQRWLLQQKRTQAWDTPINSADAIYAFLNGNSQALAPQQKSVLSLDGQPLQTSDATAGIGYVKTAIPILQEGGANGGSSRPSTFTAEKTSTGTSWGAVYAQFTQPATDIADQASGISVKREILNSQLKVGDRIRVRITIEADRDYDFVQVEDKRAACMEPVSQRSGYQWGEGYYCAPKDNATCYFFDLLSKGRHVIETEYYIDREGIYETGTCTAQCAYSPEFRGTAKALTLEVRSKRN
ncbi:MAG: alpha-2-macroglobulin [Prevotella sp.]|nr:alpha-2-macroglobulin [Prevotella sp.]